jgi:GTP-binding protein HflX
MLVRGGAPTFG